MDTAARAASIPRLSFAPRHRSFACSSFLRSKTSWMTGMLNSREVHEGTSDAPCDESACATFPLQNNSKGENDIGFSLGGDQFYAPGNEPGHSDEGNACCWLQVVQIPRSADLLGAEI